MTVFDTFVMVDWSAGKAKPKRPTKDAIWAGLCRNGVSEAPTYLRNRIEAEHWLFTTLSAERAAGRRVLAGFDFPFGYPSGFGKRVVGSDDPFLLWDWLEARITDDEAGTNNRFLIAEEINAHFPGPGPFWGKPSQDSFPGIPYRKSAGVVFDGFDEHRECERASKAPSSCFQLFFNPTVGSQVLMGLPVLNRLRRALDVSVWPFEEWDDAPIVFAEVWPGLIEAAVPKDGSVIRDEAQMRLLAEAVSRQSCDTLCKMMKAPDIARIEGWILGADVPDQLLAALLPPLSPPRLKNDCFALPPGVDWTPVDVALTRLKDRLSVVVSAESMSLEKAKGRVLATPPIAQRSNPPAPNSAVDGYAIQHGATSAGDQTLPLVQGRAAAGAPFERPVPKGHAIQILTGALLPEGVDTVLLEEDVATDGSRIAFVGPIKRGANTRQAGEDVERGQRVLGEGVRLRPMDIALLASVGIAQVSVFCPLRVGVLSTGDEIVPSASTMDTAKTFDANRPMLLALLSDWQMEAVDLGHAPDDREALRGTLDAAAKQCDVILTSGGASAGQEDHVSALLGEAGSRADWRIALKPGRPLALGMWSEVPVFGLPGNPVAALVCTLIFARPAFGLLGGEGWRVPKGFLVPSAFKKTKKAGRREYLRARMTEAGTVDVFLSEGSGRISGLAWAEGLVELGDDAAEIAIGDPVRFIPYESFR